MTEAELREFVLLVLQMRDVQIKYRRLRSRENLVKAEHFEKKVDTFLESANQPMIFFGENNG